MAHIKVGDKTPKNQYIASAGQTLFTYTFPIFSEADVRVFIGSDLKTLTSDYTMTGVGTDNGGEIAFLSGVALDSIVTFTRDMPVARTSDYQTNGDFLADTINDDLDKLTMMSQQQEDKFKYTLSASEFDKSVDMTLPLFDTRLGTVLTFDAITGAPTAGPTVSSIMGAVTDATMYALAAEASAGTASTANSDAQTAQSAAEQAETDTGTLKDDTQDLKDDTQGLKDDVTQLKADVNSALAAASIPGTLTNEAGKFLQVKQDETMYELVSSVAAPQFYGLKMSADGLSIDSTYGEETNKVEDYDAWVISEGVTFAINNNELQAVL